MLQVQLVFVSFALRLYNCMPAMFGSVPMPTVFGTVC